MERGRIVRGIGSFYTVVTENGGERTCRARGRFRRAHLVPMIGDMVEITAQPDGAYAIERILPRSNELVRPPVSNIDQLVIVVAASAPRPDLLLVDKLLVACALKGVSPLLVLNKTDEAETEITDTFLMDYAAFPVLAVSSLRGDGMDALTERLAGKVSCFAGQSAVGKSSLLNVLLPGRDLEVGGLAKKTEHGRHTTRRAELWPFLGGAVLDTPGFSLLDTELIEQDALNRCYPEFGDAPARCRFAGCTHVSEPDCAVKDLLAAGTFPRGRYERYCILLAEIAERRKHQYD